MNKFEKEAAILNRLELPTFLKEVKAIDLSIKAGETWLLTVDFYALGPYFPPIDESNRHLRIGKVKLEGWAGLWTVTAFSSFLLRDDALELLKKSRTLVSTDCKIETFLC